MYKAKGKVYWAEKQEAKVHMPEPENSVREKDDDSDKRVMVEGSSDVEKDVISEERK